MKNQKNLKKPEAVRFNQGVSVLNFRFPPGLVVWGLLVFGLWGTSAGMAGELNNATVYLKKIPYQVEVAETDAEQELGLGGRKVLKKQKGMLFLYPDRGRRTFWMKGMKISIDILWLNNRQIVHIEHKVPPPPPGTKIENLKRYTPPAQANAVLEIPAGAAQALRLKTGDLIRIVFP